MRWTAFLFFLATTISPGFAAAEKLTVGVYSNPPLSIVESSDKPTGLFPELLNEIAKKQDWQLNYTPCGWQECLEQLESGSIDLLPVIAYTDERAKKYRFVEETVLTSWGQIYQRSGDKQYDSILQLSGQRLAVLENDVYFVSAQGLKQTAQSFGVDIKFVVAASYEEVFQLLADGKVDAAMVGRLYGLKHYQQFGLVQTPLIYKPIQVRVAFSPQSHSSLVGQFDQQLGAWKEVAGSPYHQLFNKWVGEKITPTTPKWLQSLMYGLAAILCLLLMATLWTRQQVKVKTRLLAEKNRLLEDELIEREQVENALRESKQQYQVMFEDNLSIMLLIDPETIHIVDANPAACRFYQYRREQLQGMPISRLNGLSAEDVKRKTEQITSQELSQFEMVHTRADGSSCPVEIQSSSMVVGGRTLICSIVRDISKRKHAEKQLEERNDFLQSVIDGVGDPLMVIDFEYQVLQMNEAAYGRLQPALSDQEAFACYQVSHASSVPCDGDDHPCPIREVRETGLPVTVIHNHVYNGKLRIVELNASPLYNAAGELYAVIEVARDITERQRAEELLSENEKRLHHLAHHDTLTDLPNRLLFEDRLKQALSKAKRSRKQVALFFIDLDHFKDINDNLGHDFGDLLLVDVAKRLSSCVRESDTVARLGGDEFLVLLEEIDSIPMLELMAERICQSMIHELDRENFSQRVSASVGISIFPEDGSNGQDLLKAADQAMYRAKGKGKATFEFASTPQGRFDFS